MHLVHITVFASLMSLSASGCSKSSDDDKDKGTAGTAETSDTKSESKSSTSESRPEAKTSDGEPARDTSDAEFKRYQVKSGIIEYQVSGMQTGTETLYFDDWGWSEATYTQVELNVSGHKSTQDSVTIIDKKYSHNFDVVKRTGLRVAEPLGELIAAAKKQGKDMTDVGLAMMQSMGGKKIGTETIAGHECDIYEMKSLNTKTWIYRGLTLKTESSMANMSINKVAIKADFDVAVPSDKFVVPADIKFRDLKSPM